MKIYKTTCPDYHELEQLLQNSLPDDRAAQLRSHISHCRECCDIFEQLYELGADYVNNTVVEINTKVDKRVSCIICRKAGKIKAAALASVLVVISFFIIRLASSHGAFSQHFFVEEKEPLKTNSYSGAVSGSLPKPKLLDRGIAYMNSGDYIEAKNIFEQILNEYKANDDVLKDLGICEMNLLNYSQALQYFEQIKPVYVMGDNDLPSYIKHCRENIR